MMKSLIDSLACSFDEFVSYPTTDVKGTVHMHIRNDDPEEVTQVAFRDLRAFRFRYLVSHSNSVERLQVVAALSLLGELDKRLKKWASYVVKNFVQPIIDSETGVDPYERITVTVGLCTSSGFDGVIILSFRFSFLRNDHIYLLFIVHKTVHNFRELALNNQLVNKNKTS